MVIDEWQGCNADECPYDKEYGDCENCSYLIRKQDFVPMSVLEEYIRQMKSEIADSLEFWDYSPNNNPLARDILETLTYFWGDIKAESEEQDADSN